MSKDGYTIKEVIHEESLQSGDIEFTTAFNGDANHDSIYKLIVENQNSVGADDKASDVTINGGTDNPMTLYNASLGKLTKFVCYRETPNTTGPEPIHTFYKITNNGIEEITEPTDVENNTRYVYPDSTGSFTKLPGI